MSNGERVTMRDYQDALDVQNACNLSGVVYSFARVMEKISNESYEQGKGTDWKNHHPIAVLYASKIASLTGSESMVTFADATVAVELAILESKKQEQPK